ncbi:Oxidoreductase family, C-terminal alpha/beta domain [Algibacter lectus]|uniref:Gfo/Idh/MocA family protein n=1 Tax=Algibacter lectus TaxID=221126 RepID=UPI0008DF0970|nr:Gfo/Idh/MocA family oxidoreductase [Algibacter lectus]SFB89253.1 Oxidoreductase family, C-terminal alpha/beta domain [Algibacter lectus]
MERRDLLKNLGLLAGAAIIPNALQATNLEEPITSISEHFLNPLSLDKPITVITIGAGARGNTYSNYSVHFPNQMNIIGVAEPVAERNNRYAEKYNIIDENRFDTWERVFERPKFADAVIISTPDQLHYAPCMKALEMGYDVLLEKPISPSEEECLDILRLAKEKNRIVAVCHVLRYAPYFIELKKMIDDGAVGELVSIDHFEPIEHTHMAHSYVRGNWHNSKTSTPIILAKSCHDMDIMRWLINEPCESIASYGNVKWFKEENAPEGSTARCTDGCAVESTCPYSAVNNYYRKRQRTHVFDLPKDKEKQGEYIMEKLRTTNYGKCVYKSDNDQPDHYVSSMQFKDGITANFSMEAFTAYHGRRTRIMGSMGDIVGDMDTYTHTDFRTGKKTERKVERKRGGIYDSHGGGDLRLVADWLQAVSKQDATLLTSTIDASIESHVMCFKSEESRLGRKMVEIK